MPKLLIVDDDKDLRNLVLTYAKIDGYQCDEAKDGQDALNKIDIPGQVGMSGYDLLILDVMMPVWHGWARF